MDYSSNLLEKASEYLSGSDVAKIKMAYEFSSSAHSGQFRSSGEPYITHPVAVARLLADFWLDCDCIVAALLHDVLEDTPIESTIIQDKFGVDVANLVIGVSKLTVQQFLSSAEAQAENIQKYLLASVKDVRVILIKLMERLHSMRTILGTLRPDKRSRIARETFDIYVPIAGRLGLHQTVLELEDLCFMNLYPIRYQILRSANNRVQESLSTYIQEEIENFNSLFESEGVSTEIYRERANVYGLYREMKFKARKFEDASSKVTLRIVVGSVKDCYVVLGLIHGRYRPMPPYFKDYIAIPRTDGYRSLHTVVFNDSGRTIKLLICSEDMYKMMRDTTSVHWMLSPKGSSTSSFQNLMKDWRKEIFELNAKSGSSLEFIEHVKADLLPDELFVYDDKGNTVEMPNGSTPVDFAYEIGAEYGNSVVAARINGRLVPLSTPMRSGDTVHTITAPGAQPNRRWLSFVVTGKAKASIRDFLRHHKDDIAEQSINENEDIEEEHRNTRDEGSALDLTTERESMHVSANEFFIRAGFDEIRLISERCYLLVREGREGNAVYCEALPQDFDGASSVPQFITRQEFRKQGATCLYILYDPQESDLDTGTLVALRNTIESDVVPLDISTVQDAIRNRSHCGEVLKTREEPYIIRSDPYFDSSPIRDPAMFFGRGEILEKLPGILARGQHVGVFGTRKIGKTSLLHQLQQRILYTPRVFIDCQGLGSKAEHIFYALINGLEKVKASFGIFGNRDIPAFPDELIFTQYFQDFYSAWVRTGNGSPVVLLFDEIDKLFRDRNLRGSAESLHEYLRVFRTLRSIAQTDRSLVTVITAYRPDINRQNRLSEGLGENPMFQAFQEFYLGVFPEDDCAKMIREIGRWKDIQWQDEAISNLFRNTGGHPLISRYLASFITNGGKLKDISSLQVDVSVNEVFQDIRKNEIGNYFKEGVWETLRDQEKEVLELVASDNRVHVRDIENDGNQTAIANLQHFGLISIHDQRLSVNGNLFQYWIQEMVLC